MRAVALWSLTQNKALIGWTVQIYVSQGGYQTNPPGGLSTRAIKPGFKLLLSRDKLSQVPNS
jgi:hypothetical protein